MIADGKIRVLIVEDSVTQRAFLRRSLEADGDIVVIGEAGSALNAVVAVQHGEPDVVTMDLNIPGGGVNAIERIMASSPRPILLLSGQVGGPRSPAAVDALGAGAVGVLVKPRRWDDSSQQLLRTRVRTLRRVRPPTVTRARTTTDPRGYDGLVVGIGSSTGGPAALSRLLRDLTDLPAPILCVQHIDDQQVDGLARWLSTTAEREVRVASDGDSLEPGVVLVGRGGYQLTLDAHRRVVLVPDSESLHRPSVDQLFCSLAQTCGADVVAALLTGMGRDGADGMRAVREAGGVTFAQDEYSSVVYGMARAAVELGAVGRVLPIGAIGSAIMRSAGRRR